MEKIKCNILNCNKELNVENKEVRAINIKNDGYRFVCVEHYNYIKENNIKPTLELIYGPKREKKHENKNFFRNQKWTSKPAQGTKN